MAEAPPVSVNEKKFIENALRKGIRVDGRKALTMRKLQIQFGRKAGTVEVSLGKTRVFSACSADVVKPYPDRPSEGFLRLFVDFSPMASPYFEHNRPSGRSVQLSRMVQRGIRESNAVDTESLCILSGSRVWEIRCDVRVLDDDGNLGDCANIAAVCSLLHFRRPDVTVVGDRVTLHSVDQRQPVQLAMHHIPIIISFGIIAEDESLVMIDPNRKETTVSTAELSFTVNKHKEICGIHKIGGTPLNPNKILKYANVAIENATAITEKIEKLLAEEEKSQQKRSRRGESVYTNPIEAFIDNPEMEEEKGETKKKMEEEED
ncbi:hypothetical protein AAMO2058_001008100 [Amorphochlora amoebiformis]